MSKIIALDIESDYDAEYSLRKMSTWKYVFDPRFNAYLVAVVGDGIEFVGDPRDFQWDLLADATLAQHNAGFDGLVMERLKQDGVIKKDLPYGLFCTADMSCFMRAPRDLKGAVKQLLGKDLDKGMRDYMKGKKYYELSPEDKAKMSVYGMSDAKPTLELCLTYGNQWPAEEQLLSRLNRESCWFGVRTDQELVDEGIQILQHRLFEAVKAIPWTDEYPPLSPKAVRIQGRKDGIPVPASLAKDDEAAIAWENEYGPKFPWIQAIKDWRSINTLLKKIESLRDGAIEGGIFPFSKKYFGAVTGRFSGGGDTGGKFNMENMYREPIVVKLSDTPEPFKTYRTYKAEEDQFAIDLRRTFVARENHSFVISDYAQVEPRLLLWRVGDTAMLKTIENGLGIYEAHARQYMGYTDPRPLKKTNDRLYRLAKARVIGLGYGCGKDKFVAVAKQMADVIITLEESEFQVTDYRNKSPLILSYWSRHNSWLKISAGHKDDEHEVRLASGRSLKYFNPRYRKTKDADGKEKSGIVAQDERGGPNFYLWGGVLTENEIQALARDVLRDAWIALAAAGYHVLFSVHDELIIEVPDDQLATALPDIERIMTTSSPWAQGCPLGVESHIAKAYCK